MWIVCIFSPHLKVIVLLPSIRIGTAAFQRSHFIPLTIVNPSPHDKIENTQTVFHDKVLLWFVKMPQGSLIILRPQSSFCS